jgi:hypothetical protein
MNTAPRLALGALLALLGSSQALACYTIYDRANRVIYHAAAAPVDMRYPLHQTLPAVFPGGHLVFSVSDTQCPPVDLRQADPRQRMFDTLGWRQAGTTGVAGTLGRGEEVLILPARP